MRRLPPVRLGRHLREVEELVREERNRAKSAGSAPEEVKRLDDWLAYVDLYKPPLRKEFVVAVVGGTNAVQEFVGDEDSADRAWLAERIRAADKLHEILDMIPGGGAPSDSDSAESLLNVAHREVFGALTARINVGPHGPNSLSFADLPGAGMFVEEAMTVTLSNEYLDPANFFHGLLTVVHETVHEQQAHRRQGSSWVPAALRRWQGAIDLNRTIHYFKGTGLLGPLYVLQPIEADAFNTEALVLLRLALRTGGRPEHAKDLGARRRQKHLRPSP